SNEKPMHVFNVVNKDQIEALTKTEESAINAKMLTVRGESKNPGLLAGCKFDLETKDGTYDYVITRVIHYSNVMGHYQNSFTAVPATVIVPPYTNPHVFRKADTQTAMVKENHDSDGLGRVKVQFHWQMDPDMSPWLRVSTPHAGGGKGMHFIPEKDEEVIVDFEGGDADKPFIAGSMFNGKAKSGRGDADNNVKGLQTRSGNKVELDDKAGSVNITDKAGNKIFIDGAGKIEVESSDSITLTGGNSIKLVCGESSIELKKDGTIEIKGGKIVDIQGTSDSVKITSTNKVDIKGTASASLTSDAKVDIGSPATSIEGKASLKLQSTGIVDVEGTAMTNVKGGVVNLN
ncbi:MAG: phage baseplate assembly protein V, partial [Bacteroidota bacterium]